MNVLGVFFREPTKLHFIKEISKEIKLAPTSVRNHIHELLKDGMIKKKKSEPFDGFIANRENTDFLFYKRVYNFYSLKNLTDFIVSECYPKTVILFGSYSRGEDVETSDIDLVIVSKQKIRIDVKKFEKDTERTINIMAVRSLEELEDNIKKKVANGIILHGGI